MMDDAFRKIIRPVDSRGSVGIFSRGKAIYRGVSNSPKPGNAFQKTLEKAMKERLQNGLGINQRSR